MQLGIEKKLEKKELSSIFTFPIRIDEMEFEDITFYKSGKVKCAICSHEEYCVMELFDQELEEFKRLGIPYQAE